MFLDRTHTPQSFASCSLDIGYPAVSLYPQCQRALDTRLQVVMYTKGPTQGGCKSRMRLCPVTDATSHGPLPMSIRP